MTAHAFTAHDGATGLTGEPGPDASAFRAAFRSAVGTVSVITAGGPLRPVGFTATSLVSVSVDPLYVSFNISRGASSWPTVRRAGHVAAHLLHRDQQDVATAFATSGIDRFAAAGSWASGPHGLPVLDRALARLILAIRSRTHVGDSAVVLAEVVDIEHTPGAPLAYHDGGYREIAPTLPAPASAPAPTPDR